MYSKFRRHRSLSRDEMTYYTTSNIRQRQSSIICTMMITLCVLIGCGLIGLFMIHGYRLYLRQFHGKIIGPYGRPPLNPRINNEPYQSGRGILSVVLPTHCDRFHAAELTLESLAAYTETNTFDELILVSPERCPFQPIISKQLSNIFTSGIQSISDESLIPHIENTQLFKHHWTESTQQDSHAATWHKQMILKLAIGFVVKSPFFLILDDDVTMINHASLQDFVSVQWVQKKENGASLEEQPVALIPDVVNTGQRQIKSSESTGSQKYELSLRANWQYDYSNWVCFIQICVCMI